jgi:hypothetical protein
MIALWVGNDLSPSDIASVEAHVIDCVECQGQVEKLMSSSDILASFNSDSPRNPNDSVWPGLKQQLPVRRSGTELRSGLSRSFVLAVSILTASVAVAILPDYFAASAIGTHPVRPVQSISFPNYEVRDDGFVRYYYDPSWRSLERLDSRTDGAVQNSVIGRNVGY